MSTLVNSDTTVQEGAVSLNPATAAVIGHHPYDDAAALEQALTSAADGFKAWAATPVVARTQLIADFAAALRRDIDALAKMAAEEMGKPVVQGRAEVEKCAVLCDWYAQNGAEILVDGKTQIGEEAYVSYLPIGTVLAVMPWNFPFWQVIRGAVPILLGGNGYMLKHAPNVMGCAYMLERLFEQVGLPKGTFSVVNTTNELTSMAIADDRIAAVAVTGSVRAGSAIAAQAGAALKKSVLELGGSDAFIVLADADIDAAVKGAVIGRFQNTGQICIAAKRIILEASIAQEFTEKFVAAVAALKMGDPMDEATYLGPMARYDLRDELDGQVQASIAQGAKVLLGGHKVDGAGNYYAPTVLADVTSDMTVFKQETFGPVAALIVCRDADHAVALANDSEFGLSGALWTRDYARAKEIARNMHTGGMFINGFSASDPRIPIGGVKKSGYGRELSHFGVLEFMNAQTVWFDRK